MEQECSMADVYNYIEPQGVIVTDTTGEILTEVITEYQNAFGQDLVVPTSDSPQSFSTPQGLLITAEALARQAVADNNAMLANQINPNVAGGVFLDAIMALTGLERTPAEQSFCTINLNGAAGTSIPAGSQLSETTYGNIFYTFNTYVIPSNGTYTGATIFSLDYGPIKANANSTWILINQVLGWETATNNTEAIGGAVTQSDVAARAMRLQAIGLQGSSIAAAIIAAVTVVINSDNSQSFGIPSVKYLENPTSTGATVEGVTMVANSIYLCVNGGDKLTSYTSVIVTCTGTATTVIPASSIIADGSQVSETVIGNTYVFNLNPNVPFTLNGTLAGTTTITMADTTGVFVGQAISGNGIPASTTVSTVTPSTSIVISNAATLSGLQNLTFTSTNWVIGDGGTVDIPCTCITSSGPVPAPIGDVNTIVTAVSGWASVTNAAAETSLGIQSDVAYAIMSKKSAGCSYNNGPGINISAVVIEPASGQYLTVLYDNPNQVPIYIIVNAIVVTPVVSPVLAIQQAIINYVNGGLNGVSGWGVGQNVSAFEIAGAITTQLPGIYVKTLFTSTSPTPTTSTEIAITDYQIATIANTIVNILP